MAQKVNIVLVDDLSGDELKDGETVTFGLDGQQFEIDLSKKNADKLRGSLMDYIAVARKVGGKTKRTAAAKASGEDLAAVRAWAKENGYDVSERGRVAQTVKDAYAAAH